MLIFLDDTIVTAAEDEPLDWTGIEVIAYARPGGSDGASRCRGRGQRHLALAVETWSVVMEEPDYICSICWYHSATFSACGFAVSAERTRIQRTATGAVVIKTIFHAMRALENETTMLLV